MRCNYSERTFSGLQANTRKRALECGKRRFRTRIRLLGIVPRVPFARSIKSDCPRYTRWGRGPKKARLMGPAGRTVRFFDQ